MDGNAIDLKVSVFIHVTLEKQIEENLSEFEAAIETRPEVVECYLMTGSPITSCGWSSPTSRLTSDF